MKRVVCGIALGLILAAGSAGAVAAAPSKAKPSGSSSQASTRTSGEPAGTYSAYPDWAQRAFAPKAGGSGGR